MTELLLAHPSPTAMRAYYDDLAAAGRGPGVRVEVIDRTIGKGLFADKDFEVDELVLKEPHLAGGQHFLNKTDALVCSFCFRYIGSIELQIGLQLLSRGDAALQDSVKCSLLSQAGGTSDFWPVLNIIERTREMKIQFPERRDGSLERETGDSEDDCACQDKSLSTSSISVEALIALFNGDLRLPYSDTFKFPSVVKCSGGCLQEVFCSDGCAGQAWEKYHALLCKGPNSCCGDKIALAKFEEFANETNDIFHLAGQVIAGTILRGKKLKHEMHGNVIPRTGSKTFNNAILLKAWEPFAMGHKCLWWEAVALPPDVDPSNEQVFRNQMKELASESLILLKNAIFEDEFAPLFSLEVYGHIIGMFEQNNLEIVVASPVEDYFIFIDDLSCEAKAQTELVTRPYLAALGSSYSTCCQGSGFFALQSCINHSCQPNARAFKRDEDCDGQAVLLATRPIRKGEQITISYIDEDVDLNERQAMLADYGFKCSCEKCLKQMHLN